MIILSKASFSQSDSTKILEAKNALLNKECNKALSLCNEILKQNPTIAEAYYIKAQCRLQQRNYIEVFSELNKAISKHPCYAEALALKAETHFILKDYKQSRKFYYQALVCNSLEPIYYFNIGIIETKLYKWKSAIENFSKALQFKPNYIEAIENRAYSFSMIGEFKNAISDYDSILYSEPKRDDIFIKRGMCMLGLKQFKESIPIFSRAIKMNPSNQHAFYGRGRAQFELRRFDIALHDFDTALSLKPDFETAQFIHAVTLLEIDPKNNKEQACEEFKVAAKLGYGEAWDYIRRYCED